MLKGQKHSLNSRLLISRNKKKQNTKLKEYILTHNARRGRNNGMYAKKHSEETKKKIRIAIINNVISRGIRIGTHEKKILDELEKIFNTHIIRQYNIIGYSIDGYIPELNLAIEIDEPLHNRTRIAKNDFIRQHRIQQEIGCKFLRIKDYFHTNNEKEVYVSRNNGISII